MPALADTGIQLKFSRLHKPTRFIGLRTAPVTHLAKKALKMRHKISGIRRNPLKQRSLQGHK